MKTLIALFCVLTLFLPFSSSAQPSNPDVAYYGLVPEITTNYISGQRRFGYIHIQVELMLKNADLLEEIERHDPLIRATIVDVLGQQAAPRIKTLEGREAIRQECFQAVNTLLVQELGQSPVSNLLFTKYLYD